MYLQKSGIQGSYKPSFFSLLINQDDVLDDANKVRNEAMGIFFHEYIHFLQDIMTSFGLRNFATLVRQYSVINHEIIDSNVPYFSIPYKSINESLKIEDELFNLLWGTQELGDEDRDFEVINTYKEKYIFNEKLSNLNLIAVDIIYRDTLEKDSFYLGAVHFFENIAHILESKIYYETNAPSFPYRVIEKIIKNEFNNGEFKDKNFILIMENSLEVHEPAMYFFEYLEFCNHNSLNFTESSIIEFRNSYRLKWQRKLYTQQKFYYLNATIARQGFDAMFIHEKLNHMKNWGRLLIANTIKLKRNHFSFVDLLVLNNDVDRVFKNLNLFIKKLGTPIMRDRNNKFFYVTPDKAIPDQQMLYLLGLEAVINVINNNTVCSLIPFCSHGTEDITNESCYKKPWERTKIEPLCIFAQLWIMWGFVRKEVKQ